MGPCLPRQYVILLPKAVARTGFARDLALRVVTGNWLDVGEIMLLFVDQPKHIRIVRRTTDPSGNAQRESIGRIEKKTLEIKPEVDEALQPEEKQELAQALDVYRASLSVQRRAAALRFPETLRQVYDYVQSDATAAEKNLILTALAETMRQFRKSQGDETE